MKRYLFLIFFISLNSYYLAFSDTNKEKAQELGEQAMQHFQKGEFDRAILLLNDAITLDSFSLVYKYEKALAFYQKKEFEKALVILNELLEHPEVSDQVYQLIGNCYGMLERYDDAISAYNEGLQKFPNSGRLYMELGLTMLTKTTLKNVIGYWEKGVEVDPNFQYNYYHLADYYSSIARRVWGLIYAEIFLNYELTPLKSRNICRLFKEVYSAGFYNFNDSTLNVNFTSLRIFSDSTIKKSASNFELAYQEIMKEIAQKYLSPKLKRLDAFEIATVRRVFIEKWFQKKYNELYPNILFTRHKQMLDEGIFDIYNLWLLRECNKDEFENFAKQNIDIYKKFEYWLNHNYLIFDAKNYMYRYMYDK